MTNKRNLKVLVEFDQNINCKQSEAHIIRREYKTDQICKEPHFQMKYSAQITLKYAY